MELLTIMNNVMLVQIFPIHAVTETVCSGPQMIIVVYERVLAINDLDVMQLTLAWTIFSRLLMPNALKPRKGLFKLEPVKLKAISENVISLLLVLWPLLNPKLGSLNLKLGSPNLKLRSPNLKLKSLNLRNEWFLLLGTIKMSNFFA